MFLENHVDLDDARAELLVIMSRIREAAGIYAKNYNMLRAVEILNASATRSVDHERLKIKYLLAGLRRGFAFGSTRTSSSVASKLLALADHLDKSAMSGREVNDVSSSHPSHRQVLHLTTSSLQCFERFNLRTV